jgi:dihydroorotate dehydrogenase
MLYKGLIRPILFAMSKDDAEKAHELAIRAAKKIQGNEGLLRLIALWYGANRNPEPVTVAGIPFPNRAGLAAGFDKQGEMLPLIQALGFGFAEIGTVLPHPQKGSERQRLFRIPKEEALVNRMGFNSDGKHNVACNLRAHQPHISIPIGISVGRRKETPNEEAVEDYIKAWEWLRPHAAYGVGNISSPNTAGLRDLQGGKYLFNFVDMLVSAEAKMAAKANEEPKPIAIKLAPDLSDYEIDESVDACERGGASMLIVGNTTLKRPLKTPSVAAAQEAGGMSGRQIYYRSRSVFLHARKRTSLPIIYVGGLDRYERVKQVREDGADLVQLYTGLIYKGPSLISKARRAAY